MVGYFVLALCPFAREPYEEVLRMLTSGIPGSRAVARVNRSSLHRARSRLGEDVLETVFRTATANAASPTRWPAPAASETWSSLTAASGRSSSLTPSPGGRGSAGQAPVQPPRHRPGGTSGRLVPVDGAAGQRGPAPSRTRGPSLPKHAIQAEEHPPGREAGMRGAAEPAALSACV
ncbi:transposase domain-containing protein [Streptomyces sclerotialus]|uniref:transposase domain-containing protein n=1 Tax=Streptomyces sclerotialus TaxID=1957 RepID=UPI00099D75A2